MTRSIQSVSNKRNDTKKILEVTNLVTITAAALTVLLTIASILLIANTIRLSLYSRRREVEVMKLVGATDWFIRWPFVIEGVVVGAAGAFLAIVVLGVTKVALLDPLANNWHLIAAPHTISFAVLVAILMAAGVMVSALGSGLSLRRFLRVLAKPRPHTNPTHVGSAAGYGRAAGLDRDRGRGCGAGRSARGTAGAGPGWGHRGVPGALGLTASAQAAAPVTVTTDGEGPQLAVDAAGAANVVWVSSSDGATTIHYCKLPKGATGCSVTHDFPGEAGGDARVVLGPAIGEVVVFNATGFGDAGPDVSLGIDVWVSMDGGADVQCRGRGGRL